MKKLLLTILLAVISSTAISQTESHFYPNMLIIGKNKDPVVINTSYKLDLFLLGSNLYKLELIQVKKGVWTKFVKVSEMFKVEKNGETFLVADYSDGEEVFTVEFYGNFDEILFLGEKHIIYLKKYEKNTQKIKM